jgi:uncharacterized protein (TIGR02246 family)
LEYFEAEKYICRLYLQFLQSWNKRDAAQMANLFLPDGNMIGFDGSQMNGRNEMETVLGQIFKDHPTGKYIGLVREVRLLSSDVAVLRAEAGMVPHGEKDILPAVNSVQTVITKKQGNEWSIAIFQNTPAAFHGRPELTEKLTEELRQMLAKSPYYF